jgi:hypothetical protein
MADINDTATPSATRIKFYYIKGQFFRVAHVDGVIGGVTPNGLIHAAMFSERPAIPQTTEHELTGAGLGLQVTQEGREGFVRELDIDVMMTRAAAVNIKDWLEKQIAALDQIIAVASQSHDNTTGNKR